MIPLEGGLSGSSVSVHWTSWLSSTVWARCAVCCSFDSYLLLLAVAVADFAPPFIVYWAIAIGQINVTFLDINFTHGHACAVPLSF